MASLIALFERFFGQRGGRLLQRGTEAPDFRVPDQDGRERTLSEYRGRNLILWFYPKADTPG